MPDYQARVTVQIAEVYAECKAPDEEQAKEKLQQVALERFQVPAGCTTETEITWLQRSDPT